MGGDWRQGGENGSIMAVTQIQKTGVTNSPAVTDIDRRPLIPTRKEPVPASPPRTRQRIPLRVREYRVVQPHAVLGRRLLPIGILQAGLDEGKQTVCTRELDRAAAEVLHPICLRVHSGHCVGPIADPDALRVVRREELRCKGFDCCVAKGNEGDAEE